MRAAVTHKKHKTKLIWIGAIIALLSFGSKELSESLEKMKSAIETELNSYGAYLGQSSSQLQLMTVQQQLQLILIENSPERKKKVEDRDFTAIIAQDLPAIATARSEVGVSLDSVSRLIETLPVQSADLKEQFEKLKSQIEADDKGLESVLAPSADHNWRRMLEVKLTLIRPLLNGIRVTVFGDAVQTRAEQQVKIIGFLATVTKWTWRMMIVLGLALALYGSLTEQKTLGGGE
jgi:hypothetical protein